jgi:hypothetical protein
MQIHKNYIFFENRMVPTAVWNGDNTCGRMNNIMSSFIIRSSLPPTVISNGGIGIVLQNFERNIYFSKILINKLNCEDEKATGPWASTRCS